MSLESMQSRHMAHDIVIKALIETLSEEQLASVVSSVQSDFAAYSNNAENSKEPIAEQLAKAKQHASLLLGKKIA